MTAATVSRPRGAKTAVAEPVETGNQKLHRLSEILYQASCSDGDFNSGYSLRLLRMASELALDYTASFDAKSLDDQLNCAFDLAALTSAARRVPMDLPLPASMLKLIEQARVILADLCDCDDPFDDGPEHMAAVEDAVWTADAYMGLACARNVIDAARALPELEHLAGFLDGVSVLMLQAEEPISEAQGCNSSAEKIAAAHKAMDAANGTLRMLRHTQESNGLLTAAEMLMDVARDAFAKEFPEAVHA